ncbi:hypothetical protein QUF84_03200 [Fictibacillus enclensis]|uniref:hypothetical protein n=1 Tax=Fictibacillus enclensis TaxID=1017270 RepID=UPI0024C07580|nr:hypothetical protein [Fictibacillus enclensis]MDM5197130.1 hypothetical protein [Fictibacillus enclensis]MDM5336243.1 hypothetical protein [Fictibacillus enclensis]WHY72740.1 hypothetical protein QNH15_02025 [Fictibacillus enclensis]
MFALLFVLVLILTANLIYSILFIFSFRGVKRMFESCVENDFTIIVSIAAILLFGPAYYIAAFVYKWNRLLARLAMIVVSFLFFLLLGLAIDGMSKTA